MSASKLVWYWNGSVMQGTYVLDVIITEGGAMDFLRALLLGAEANGRAHLDQRRLVRYTLRRGNGTAQLTEISWNNHTQR